MVLILPVYQPLARERRIFGAYFGARFGAEIAPKSARSACVAIP
jgi:hypothetical protein